MVIGKTLSEVCDAAQAEAASQKVQADIPARKHISDLLSVWDDEDIDEERARVSGVNQRDCVILKPYGLSC
jgi:hypothetical protein